MKKSKCVYFSIPQLCIRWRQRIPKIMHSFASIWIPCFPSIFLWSFRFQNHAIVFTLVYVRKSNLQLVGFLFDYSLVLPAGPVPSSDTPSTDAHSSSNMKFLPFSNREAGIPTSTADIINASYTPRWLIVLRVIQLIFSIFCFAASIYIIDQYGRRSQEVCLHLLYPPQRGFGIHKTLIVDNISSSSHP